MNWLKQWLADYIPATRKDIERIMSKISEFSESVVARLMGIEKAVDGISGDVMLLKSKIEDLQNSSGEISAEDQASLDSIQALIGGLETRLQQLDDATPPAEVPVEETPAE